MADDRNDQVASAKITDEAPPETICGESKTFGEAELFLRDLAEVHLLIDFVSGRVDKSLDGLAGVCIMSGDGTSVASTSAQQVVEAICKISYPPGGTIESNAQQAALMLVTKDRLNRIATPARGLTAAFTSMFAGVSLTFRGPFDKAHQTEKEPREPFFSARAAYPNLETQARRFRGFYSRLPWVALAVIAFIVWVNWDINVTSALLQQVDAANAAYSTLLSADKNFVPTEVACRSASAANRTVCEQATSARKAKDQTFANLRNLLTNGLYPLHPVVMGVRLFGPSSKPDSQSGTPTSSAIVGVTIGVIGGLNNIIVPTLFGWLGTMAGVLRSITAKVRESTLAPRDFGLARGALFLGMVAGLAVGLFYNGGDSNEALAKSLGGTITISAAGLSFLAGFGAEAFFTFLDGLLVRLFPPGQSITGDSPAS